MRKFLILAPILAVSLFGCLSRPAKDGGTKAPGSDRDVHGCIGSAGYQWSQVRQDCIRIFESGVKLVPADNPDPTSAGYLVFGADSLQAELFLPGSDSSEVLARHSLPGGGYAWNVEDDDTKNVRQVDGLWVVEQRGQTIWVQDIYPIKTAFEGHDGKRYDVQVVFERNLARVTLDGTVFDLPQYMTADGYGYKNDMADLRGRGEEATLTMRDGLTLSLTAKN